MNKLYGKFFIQGGNDWITGKRLDDNPYNDMDKENYKGWRSGWQAMNKDSLRHLYRLHFLNRKRNKKVSKFGIIKWFKKLCSN